jgi:arylsulfatase A-like enzyme
VRGGAAAPEASIIDLAPTILYLLGREIPADMDGRVLEEVLAPGLLAERPVVRGQASGDDGTRGPSMDYTPEEEAEVLQRLRDLGYLN